MHASHVLYTRTTNFLLYLIPIYTVSVGKQVHVLKKEIFMMPTKSVNVHMPNKIRVASFQKNFPGLLTFQDRRQQTPAIVSYSREYGGSN